MGEMPPRLRPGLVITLVLLLGATEARAEGWYADIPGGRVAELVVAIADDEVTPEVVTLAAVDVALTCSGVAELRAAVIGLRRALRIHQSWGVQLLLRHVELARAGTRWIATQVPFWATGKLVASWARRVGAYWLIEHASWGGRMVAEGSQRTVDAVVEAVEWVDDRARQAGDSLAAAARWCVGRL